MQKKEKITLEYGIGSTASSLYQALATEQGLSTWYADRVTIDEKRYRFFWSKTYEDAVLLYAKENQCVRYQWEEDAASDCFFEFRLEQRELTGDILLIITDFTCKEERESTINFWDTLVGKLKRAVGINN